MNFLVDFEQANIKHEILSMIIQYLQDQGYQISACTLQDESNIKLQKDLSKTKTLSQISELILSGDWNEIEKILQSNLLETNSNLIKSVLLEVYKQQYLELIESSEFQKAFTLLTKKLKPLKHLIGNQQEFKDLCYLLTCKSVQEVGSFQHWDGIQGNSREILVEKLQSLFNLNSQSATDWETTTTQTVPPHRLLTLFEQAISYQLIQQTTTTPPTKKEDEGVVIPTLLTDYESMKIPNHFLTRLQAPHQQQQDSIKCIAFHSGHHLLSGSSNGHTITCWDLRSQSIVWQSKEHKSRIWDIHVSPLTNDYMVSASADQTVKVWKYKEEEEEQGFECIQTWSGHSGDVYSCKIHPTNDKYFITGGYDSQLRMFTLQNNGNSNNSMIKNFKGHSSSIYSVCFNHPGTMIVSGSKDNTIKFWDITSGVCIKTLTQHLGEVTCVEMNATQNNLLLSCSKDNTNRLWDLRTSKPVRRFQGHQNTYSNLIRAHFTTTNTPMIVGGSEDGNAYLWDMHSGRVISKLEHNPMSGGNRVVYDAQWNSKMGLMATCSHNDSSLFLFDSVSSDE